MRTIIAGSRSCTDMAQLEAAITACGWTPTAVISGGAKGADALGEQWARRVKVPLDIRYADWKHDGRSAGYRRNEQMAAGADALIALWDGKSRGTQHMINIAKRFKLRVFVWMLPTAEP